jgi:hypothetical protein
VGLGIDILAALSAAVARELGHPYIIQRTDVLAVGADRTFDITLPEAMYIDSIVWRAVAGENDAATQRCWLVSAETASRTIVETDSDGVTAYPALPNAAGGPFPVPSAWRGWRRMAYVETRGRVKVRARNDSGSEARITIWLEGYRARMIPSDRTDME